MAKCIDGCGRDTTGGGRCKWCWGAEVRRRSLIETAEADREILAMADGLNTLADGTRSSYQNGGTRLAARLGISHVQGIAKIRTARQREARRKELGIAVEA